jgi:DNA-binding SARP family transcriptional activator
MAETRLTLFGTLHIHSPEQSIALGPTSMSALLGYLALHGSGGRAVPRSTLAGKLWPGMDSDQARQMLNRTFYRLRRAIGRAPIWLYADSGTIRLTDIQTDVDTFERYAASAHLLAHDLASRLP